MLQIQSTYFSVHFQYAFLKYVAYLQSTYLKEKIRIGYVLKSTEVRTLVSRVYSANSSHTHTHTLTRASPCILAYTYLFTQTHTCGQSIPMHTWAHSHPQAHPQKHLGTPVNTITHHRTPPHTCTHPQKPVHTPYIPAHALNVINHEIIHK